MKYCIVSTRLMALQALAVFLLPGGSISRATRQVDSKADHEAEQFIIKLRQPLHSPASIGVRSANDLLQHYSVHTLTPLFSANTA
jgi:hypothetical protein